MYYVLEMYAFYILYVVGLAWRDSENSDSGFCSSSCKVERPLQSSCAPQLKLRPTSSN
jgi:hypothetical protein